MVAKLGEGEKEKQNVLNETRSLIRLRSELTECVQYLHQNNIIHRDLKPDNVLISMDGSIKLCDFNLAKEAPNCNPFHMSKDVGTQHYMAPEFL
ncbi:unnamed protein product [Oppiella nova]|uniref:Protein kinase domain-containing protein n=1 Tax=Oppiella nova TaxID=334625 RepID=A0A7R9M309_9ACAR|nr:unnamed protein product [Oppiella nova]CAG2169821.1 unnamed protein product [Oppiella nova]